MLIVLIINVLVVKFLLLVGCIVTVFNIPNVFSIMAASND